MSDDEQEEIPSPKEGGGGEDSDDDGEITDLSNRYVVSTIEAALLRLCETQRERKRWRW